MKSITYSKRLAEFIGIMLGDGNLYNGSHKQYAIRISGDAKKDLVYHKDFIQPLFKNLFCKTLKSGFRKMNAHILYYYNKFIFTKLISFGLKEGNKINNNIGIPKWIFKNKNFLKACIRGLFDTDGSVFPKSRNPNLPQIEISSRIPKLRKDITKGLIKLGFKPSKWSKSNSPNCGLYGKKQIVKYYYEIGFNNQKHLKTFMNIYKS